jgi:hydroxymethylglutaryl-CoA lyase
MGFGNPYGDHYNEAVVLEWIKKLSSLGIEIISIADTVGLASPLQVKTLLAAVINSFPEIEIGAHLHSAPQNWKEKTKAALSAGCYRLDGALKGIGGCPMADDELVGNLDSCNLIPYLGAKNLLTDINENALQQAINIATEIFG